MPNCTNFYLFRSVLIASVRSKRTVFLKFHPCVIFSTNGNHPQLLWRSFVGMGLKAYICFLNKVIYPCIKLTCSKLQAICCHVFDDIITNPFALLWLYFSPLVLSGLSTCHRSQCTIGQCWTTLTFDDAACVCVEYARMLHLTHALFQ